MCGGVPPFGQQAAGYTADSKDNQSYEAIDLLLSDATHCLLQDPMSRDTARSIVSKLLARELIYDNQKEAHL